MSNVLDELRSKAAAELAESQARAQQHAEQAAAHRSQLAELAVAGIADLYGVTVTVKVTSEESHVSTNRYGVPTRGAYFGVADFGGLSVPIEVVPTRNRTCDVRFNVHGDWLALSTAGLVGLLEHLESLTPS